MNHIELFFVYSYKIEIMSLNKKPWKSCKGEGKKTVNYSMCWFVSLNSM